MKKITVSLSFLIAILFLIVSCTSNNSVTSSFSNDILLNQIGYPTNAQKKALIRSESSGFEIKNSKGEIVYSGKLSDPSYWELSGDEVSIADFSELTEDGEYILCISDNECSAPFEIGSSLYSDLADAALKSYYYSRVGIDIEEEFGGKWNWEAGHPDTSVMIHASAADGNRPEGITLASQGGWYDAGDYGKYIVNSSITTWTILQSFALNTEFHQNQNLNIPESGNDMPDILDEALVNLKWMMTMQDPNDGALYHKLTTKNFDSFIMPNETTAQRYFLQKSTSATLDFASTMAAASRIYQKQGVSDLAKKMQEQAQMAWNWAIQNPEVYYNQPEDVSTGAYPDTSLVDEWFWASAELYLLTGENKYKDKMMENYQDPITPKWDVVNALGVVSILTSDKRSEFNSMEEDFIAYVDYMLEKEAKSPYLISMDQFAWGSNSDVANDGMLKLVAYQLTGDRKYVVSAQNDLHYILGRNATGFSFVTGFGDKTPIDQHNRIMGADGITEPMPGYISGGPNTIVLTDCEAQGVVRSEFPAASYTDTQCSYSTNETAINWNAPLVFLASGLEFIEN
ncbi:MAG: glycoside hydrolase family 9 protein [Balneolaceae bacterium]